MSTINLVEQALLVARQRQQECPSFAIYTSIVTQLEYIQKIINKDEHDATLLKKIIIGLYAVREFYESDPEFAQLLIQVQVIADRRAKGLKVE